MPSHSGPYCMYTNLREEGPSCVMQSGGASGSKEYSRRHSNIHTGARLYECQQCHRGFAWRNSLHKHLKIHTGGRPTLRFRFELLTNDVMLIYDVA
ncbi:unnamed protein product [Boreogadus saida]